ncbi:MAG TPA: hypothetical protein VL588_01285 [Bdellovibrionota bacterium]|jgi:hypothetical protein|nr:hypothetical protein [Bdellovibrionota bacterium]
MRLMIFIAFLLAGPLAPWAQAQQPAKNPAATLEDQVQQDQETRTRARRSLGIPGAGLPAKVIPYKPKPFDRASIKLDRSTKGTLNPNIAPQGLPKQPAQMTLRRHGAKANTLVLELKVLDPDLEISRKAAVVEIYADEEVSLSKDLYTNEEWPTTNQVEVPYQIQKPGGPYRIQGEGAFTLCHKSNKVCESKVLGFSTEVR